MARKDPYLPLELEIVQEQIRRPDGRFIFRLQWQLGVTPDFDNVWMRYRHIRGSTTYWSAGNVQEMLTAISRATVGLLESPGIKREIKINHYRHTNKCSKCGGFIGKGELHECITSRKRKRR